LRSARMLFSLPEAWARKLLRKPLRRLAGVAVIAMPLAAVLSVAGLSLIPINECDLLIAGINDDRRIGPGTNSKVLQYQADFRQRAIQACRQAIESDKTNGRYWVQLAAVLQFVDPKKSYEADKRSAELGYPEGYLGLGIDYKEASGVDYDLENPRVTFSGR